MKESCCTYEWVMAHSRMSHGTLTKLVMSPIYMSGGTLTDKSCNSCNRRYGVAMTRRLLKSIGLFRKRALSNRLFTAKETYNFKEPTNLSQPIDAQTSESWHTHKWVMLHKWMNHAAHEWVTAHSQMSQVARMNESWHTYEWVMAHSVHEWEWA